jgi:Zn-dependent M32 family carboxypeptidase
LFRPRPFPTQHSELGLEAMKMLGFDFNGGRLDVSAHPFCGGVPEDAHHHALTRMNCSARCLA